MTKLRVTLASGLTAFIGVFSANALFHTFVAPRFYDAPLAGLTLPMAQASPILVALVDVVLVTTMAYFILRPVAKPIPRVEAAKAGALINLVAAWTYNLVNSALIPAWPLAGTIVDVFWHVMLGAASGVLMVDAFGSNTNPR